MTSTLVINGLQKSYGTRQVVHDVSLQVASGEVVGLLGPNGAGKTTSFYMIVGLVPSDAGEIDLNGVAISRLPIHRRATLGLSYLPQEASVFRKLSVEDNIRAVLELQRVDDKPLSKAEIEKRLNTLLAELQIERLRENQALSLSGGERRRVELPAPSRPTRASYCSTNRSQALIRSRSSRSSALCASSRSAASAC
jgi:lipopolysaccharide export system ATP-binding protein